MTKEYFKIERYIHEPEFLVDGKPARVVYSNNGQTKVTLVGRWFFMSPEDIEEEYKRRVGEGDPLCTAINDAIHRLLTNGRPMELEEGK